MPTGFVRASRVMSGAGRLRRSGTGGQPVLWLAIAAIIAGTVPVSMALAAPGPALPAPTVSDASGLSVVIRSVAASGKRITLTFDAVNSRESPMLLADRGDPMVLADDHGGVWRSADRPVRLDRLSTTSVRADLAGPAIPRTDQVSLKFNEQGGGDDRPVVTVGAIGVAGGRTIAFAQPQDRGVALTATVGYNVDGLSVVVRRLDLKSGLIEVSIMAVNGNPDEIKLVGDAQDQPFVEDDSGRKATFIPPADNANLSIPGRQRLSGVLRFAGGVASGATRLSLHFNDHLGSSDDDHGTTPRLVIDNIDIGSAGTGS